VLGVYVSELLKHGARKLKFNEACSALDDGGPLGEAEGVKVLDEGSEALVG